MEDPLAPVQTRTPSSLLTSVNVRRAGAAALALTGLLHLVLVPEYFKEATTIGWLFVLGGLASVAVAAWLWLRDEPAAWWTAAVLGGGMIVGFLLSRTVGLLGFQEGEWELSGIVSILLELAVVAAFVVDWRGLARSHA
jgi:hypothetical protein